jgi:HK97 gp10 family phage protein
MSNTDQIARLKARLAAIPENVRAAVQPQLSASGAELVVEMQRLCPADSGALRDSIKVVPGDLENQFKVEAGGVDAPYAQHVEFGTSKMHAEPFFMPAYRGKRSKIISDIKSAIVAAVKS